MAPDYDIDDDLLAEEEPRRRPEPPPYPGPWWHSPPIQFLVGMPIVVLIVMILIGRPVHSFTAKIMANWWSDRAAAKLASDDIAGALVDIDKAVEWMPRSPHLYYLRAQIYAEHFELEDHLDKALSDYYRVTSLAPSFAPAYVGRGVTWRKMRQYYDALDDFNQAVELSPADEPGPRIERALLCAVSNYNLELGLRDIDRAIEQVGEPRADLLHTRGFLLYRLDRLDESLTDLDQALQLAEQDKAAALDSESYAAMDSAEQQRIERLHNQTIAGIHQRLGLVHSAQGDYNTADSHFNTARSLGYDRRRGGV